MDSNTTKVSRLTFPVISIETAQTDIKNGRIALVELVSYHGKIYQLAYYSDVFEYVYVPLKNLTNLQP